MTQYHLYLFGAPRLEHNGRPVEVNLRKALALFIYLAHTRQTHTRDSLATLFWPDKGQRTARANLRRILYDLGQLGLDRLLDISTETVCLRPNAPLWLDTEEFDKQLVVVSATPSDTESKLPHLLRASEIYTADFTAGFTLPDCPEFDDWQFFQREELRQAFAATLQQLVHTYETVQQWERAIFFARRWLALDPLEEPVHCRLMQLYAQASQTAAALRQYEECVRILAGEMDAPPAQETTALYDAIRTRRFPPPAPARDRPVTTGSAPDASIAHLLEPPITRSPQPALPVQTTPFVGRSHEIDEIIRLLADPNCRLLTLVGPGGIGKSRLSLAAAQTIVESSSSQTTENPAFADGLFFVPLQSVSTTSGMVAAIADALGWRFFGDGEPRQHLLQTLRDRQMLLVLDNFEQLPQGVHLVVEILESAPGVKLLITSRESLDLQEAWMLPVAGMSFPKEGASSTVALADYDAVRLFSQCARQMQSGFSVEAEQVHVVRICRLVGGMPLALELAASWLKVLPCKRVADEIERSLDILSARHQNIPVRHRSMRAVLEQSWRRLLPDEQAVLRKLSVFRGGCTYAAVAAVAGATLHQLTSLVDKAFVQFTPAGRYEIHELIRQFAQEQMQTAPREQEEAQQRHCAYYATFLQEQTPGLKSGNQPETFAALLAELGNIRAAWQHALVQRDAPLLARAAEALWIFCDSRGAFYEGEAALGRAVESFMQGRTPDEVPAEQRALVGFLLAGQGYLGSRRGHIRQGQTLMEQGVALLGSATPPSEPHQAIALLYLGWLAASQSQIDRADKLCNESLAHFTALDDQWGVAACIELKSSLAKKQGRLAEAERLLSEGLALASAIGAHKLRGGFLHNLADIDTRRGRYAQAEHRLRDALAIGQSIGTLPGITTILRDLARLSLHQGNLALAIELTNESQQAADAIEPQWRQLTGKTIICEAYRLQGLHTVAEQGFLDSLQMARASGTQFNTADCLAGLSALALARGEIDRAEELQREAVAFWEEMGQEIELGVARGRLGRVLAAGGPARAAEAQRSLMDALQVAYARGLAPIALDVFVDLLPLMAHEGRDRQAAELAALAKQHPASRYETRQNASQFLEQLTDDALTSAAAFVAGQLPDWRTAAEGLMRTLVVTDRHTGVVAQNLPPQPTPFIGRARELMEVVRCLQAPECRLLTLVGPGGIGKTRLALQAAQTLIAGRNPSPPASHTPQIAYLEFPDGLFFVPLHAVGTGDGMISAIAEATGFRFYSYSDAPPRQQLLNFLRAKRLLLVLDNLEHLDEAPPLVEEILTAAPHVTLLATSQKSLNLREEWFHPLTGMALHVTGDVPLNMGQDGESHAPADAIQLFAQCARHARADFALEAEYSHVARICRLVDGIPLAIELAATWLKVLPSQKIADEIERGLDILTTRQQNVPTRHRSMVAVLTHTWQLLSEEERGVLKRLSVFHGGFTQEAAQHVAGATLIVLASLVEKALLWVSPRGRYHMHELLRHFAHQALTADPDVAQTTQRRHSDYYLNVLTEQGGLLTGKTRQIALDAIGAELDNVRAGWRWAVAEGDPAMLATAAEPFYHFYQLQSRYQDGKESFELARQELDQRQQRKSTPSMSRALMRMLARAGAFCHFLCEYDLAADHLRRGLDLAGVLDDQTEAAFVHNFLGQLAVWKGDRAGAKHHLLLSLTISQELGDHSGAANALEKLANLSLATFGEYAESKRLAAESLAISRQLGRPDWIAYALDTLGFVTFCLGEYEASEADYRESLTLFEQSGDQYGVAMAQGGVALTLWAMTDGRSDEAVAYFEQSLSICRAIGHQGQVAGRLAGLARIANDVGDYARAHELAAEGLTIAREVGSPVYLAHILCCLGETAYATGDLASARRYLFEAIHLTSKSGLLANLAMVLYHYATLLAHESRNTTTQAESKRIQAMALLALVRDHAAAWRVYQARAMQRIDHIKAQWPQTNAPPAPLAATDEGLQDAVRAILAEDAHSNSAFSRL